MKSTDSPKNLDRVIAEGLVAMTAEVEPRAPSQLAVDLERRRYRSAESTRSNASTRPRRAKYLAVAATVVVLAAGVTATALFAGGGEGPLEIVTEPPRRVGVFDSYAPGWHEIDPGPVPAMNTTSLSWSGTELIVTGSTPDQELPVDQDSVEAGTTWATRTYAYSPQDREWRRLPDLALEEVSTVVAEGQLVAVGMLDPMASPAIWGWSTLDLADEQAQWSAPSKLVVAPQLASDGGRGPDEASGLPTVIWTGARVIDVTHGSVLDLATASSVALAMPDDVINWTHLLSTNAVWTGKEIIAVTPNIQPGLAWNATGTEYREVPGIPVELDSEPGVIDEGIAVGTHGRVYVMDWNFDPEHPGRTLVLDLDGAQWSEAPIRQDSPSAYCPMSAAVTAGAIVTTRCEGTDGSAGELIRLVGEEWETLGNAPTDPSGVTSPGCCGEHLLGTEEALFVWTTSLDTTNDPQAPYADGALWIPDP